MHDKFLSLQWVILQHRQTYAQYNGFLITAHSHRPIHKGCTTCGPRADSTPRTCYVYMALVYSWLKSTRNTYTFQFSCTLVNDSDFMNLNSIELSLLTIWQLITIQNSSRGNKIKPQAIKGQLNKNFISVFAWYRPMWLSKAQIIIFVFALTRTKTSSSRPTHAAAFRSKRS